MAATKEYSNTQDFLAGLRRELKNDLEVKSETWGFKFDKFRPASTGKISWESITPDETDRRNASFTHIKLEID